MQQNKIEAAITGIGAITPIGNDCESILASLRAGRDGIAQATKIDASRFASQMCGETHFDYAAEMSAAELETFTDPFLRLAISAARRAAKNAGLPALPPRTAAVLATCNAGLNSGEAEYVAQYRDPSVKFGKAELDQYENYAIGKAVADALKIGGECIVINTACSGSTAALGIAQSLVESGRYDCVLAGGADAAALSNFAGFNAIKVMSPEKIAPFSTPVGMNIGEGTAFWIIENRGIAKARGAKIYGKIVGHATSGDAHHPTQPDPRGDGAFRTMRDAAADAGISPADAGCINAHGSGTAANDRAESKGIAKFLGGANVPTTSTKSYTGHCMGATGIIEATCQLLAMNDNFIPPTLRNVGARAGCEIEAVGGAGIETEYDRFISANYAFAGNNAAVVVAKDSFVRREKPESEVRAVITGCSAITPLGIGTEKNIDALENGESGVAKISRFESERSAGLVNLPNPRTLDRRVDFSGMTPIAVMATLAAKGTLDKAGLRIRRDNCESVGLAVSTCRGSSETAHMEAVFSSPDNRGDIACFSNITPNSTAGWVSKALEIKGANITLTSGPNSGLQTLGHAARLVRENAAKSVLAIAADELYKREIDAYEKFGKIHRGAIEENFRLSFSTPSCGVLGEGAAAALVEDAETAKARGAKILGEILAFAAASDACAFGSHNLDGDGLLRAAREALDAAKIRAEEIDLVLWSPRGCAQDSVAVFVRDTLFPDAPMLASSLNTGYLETASAPATLVFALEALAGGRPLWKQRTGVKLFDEAKLPDNPKKIMCIASSEWGNNYALLVGRGEF